MTSRRTFMKQLLAMGVISFVPSITVGEKEKPITIVSWNPEMKQDIEALHGIDFEKELLEMWADQLGTTADQVVVLEEWTTIDPYRFSPIKHARITVK